MSDNNTVTFLTKDNHDAISLYEFNCSKPTGLKKMETFKSLGKNPKVLILPDSFLIFSIDIISDRLQGYAYIYQASQFLQKKIDNEELLKGCEISPDWHKNNYWLNYDENSNMIDFVIGDQSNYLKLVRTFLHRDSTKYSLRVKESTIYSKSGPGDFLLCKTTKNYLICVETIFSSEETKNTSNYILLQWKRADDNATTVITISSNN